QHLAELFQKAQVITEEVANIVDAVLQHGNTLRPHAKGKAAKHLGVIAAIVQYLGMHHARPENFQPFTVLPDRPTLPPADQAVHIDLNAGLGKREMAAAKTHLTVLVKHAAGEGHQDTFEVGHRDVRAHSEAFNLMEHDFRACRDGLIAVAHARQDDPNGL